MDPSYHAVLREMTQQLRHRGPDDVGFHIESCAMLGHRRLSIIDLETGRQPLSNEDGSIWAVVNGEFYNFQELRESLIHRGHSFRTTGDCECLVHLYEDYGERCVEHVSGFFAFAIWDSRRRKLILARDRLGVKPVYYAVVGEKLAFASELKSLLVLPELERRVDVASLLDFLTLDFVPSPRTIFSGIRKLAPGTMLILEEARATVETYWDLHAREPLSGDADEIATELWRELRRSTRERLVSDVPIGALLSGGLDSGAVVGAMAGLTRGRVVTVTSGFEEAGFDERDAAGATARQFQTEHHEHLVRGGATEILNTLAWHFDEPFGDPSAIPMFHLCLHAKRHVTVALSGDGGDEILAGYRRYRFDLAEQRVRRWTPTAIRSGLFGSLAAVCPSASWLPRPLRARSTFRNLAVDGATAHGLSIAGLSPILAKQLLHAEACDEVSGYDPLDGIRRHYRRCDAGDHLSKCQYVDIKLGLADGILTKVDRASMAQGLEVRSPMLDYRFVEFAWRIPPRHRIRGGQGKLPLRRAVQRELSGDLAARKKAGFDVPMDRWTRGVLRKRIEESLLESNSPIARWLAPGTIRRVCSEHLSGQAQNGNLVWKLLMLDAWARRHLTFKQKANDRSMATSMA
ncbi:MAG: asparagine synthase (glutamine-hydrolyzing) [Planctomycetes bacterium]|nr:asparagine synthase (glutamine-hydrolyzing) [Planctomycetota bacterium]